MQKDRERVHEHVLDEYDTLYGFRPEKPREIALDDGDPERLDMLVSRLRSTLGIDEEGALPEGTLDDLIDYLYERWEGEPVELEEP